MAENDIYNSELSYRTILRKVNYGSYLKYSLRATYSIKNSANPAYFSKLAEKLDTKDI